MLRRPIFCLGIVTLIASFLLPVSSLAALLTLLLSAGLIVLLSTVKCRENLIKGVLLALIFILLALRMVFLVNSVESRIVALSGESATIVGEVTELSNNSVDFSVFEIKIEECELERAVGVKAKAVMNACCEAVPGERIKAEVTFNKNDEYELYNLANGVYISCEIDKLYDIYSGGPSLYGVIYSIREKVISAIDLGGIDEESAVLKALLIGEKSQLSDETESNVKATGVSHMLVVSGLHLGIICGTLYNFLKKRLRLVAAVIIGSFTACFIVFLCLFHVSVLRAGIAYLIMLIGRLIKRTPDPLSSLGFGIAAIIFVWPYSFYNLSFLLSVAATYAVLEPARILINAVSFKKLGKLEGAVSCVYEILIISLCCLICTLPILSYCYGYISLSSLLANLLTSFAVSGALILGSCAVVASLFFELGRLLCLPLLFIAKSLVKYFLACLELIGAKDFGVVWMSEDKNICCFFISVAFIVLVKLFHKYKKKKEGNRFAERKNT